MASSKAYYWLALAVLALGLNSEYQRGRMQSLHSLVNRSAMTVNCFALRAQEYVSLARVLMGGTPTAPASAEWAHTLRQERGDLTRMVAELAGRQSDLARLGVERAELVRVGTEIARHQADFARLQAENSRMVVKAEDIRKTAACKDGEFRFTVDVDNEDVPDSVEVPDTF
jgi:septal ring factor EnvC (AmiA/AmiB activator)